MGRVGELSSIQGATKLPPTHLPSYRPHSLKATFNIIKLRPTSRFSFFNLGAKTLAVPVVFGEIDQIVLADNGMGRKCFSRDDRDCRCGLFLQMPTCAAKERNRQRLGDRKGKERLCGEGDS